MSEIDTKSIEREASILSEKFQNIFYNEVWREKSYKFDREIKSAIEVLAKCENEIEEYKSLKVGETKEFISGIATDLHFRTMVKLFYEEGLNYSIDDKIGSKKVRYIVFRDDGYRYRSEYDP